MEIQENMKKCPFCAEEIKAEAIVCRYCGRDLPKPIIKTPEENVNLFTEKPKIDKPKKKWLAVLLNCFPLVLGLGYIYLRKWKHFVIVFVLQLFSWVLLQPMDLQEYNSYLLGIIWIVSIIDVYVQAERLNNAE